MEHLEFLPLREIHPSGWLMTFLKNQVSGMTGHPSVHGYPYDRKFWGDKSDDKNPYAAWWPYEQTAYWLDGALKCGYWCEDASVFQMSRDEIDYAIEHTAPDGFIGPEVLRNKDRWPYAVFFRAVIGLYEITNDSRYIHAMVRHYKAMTHPLDWDRDVTAVEILVYLYKQTGDESLLKQAEELYITFNQRWPEHDCSIKTLTSDKKSTQHGVTFNEITKLTAILYAATGKAEYLEAGINGFAKLDRDQLLADGMHSCSEHLRGRDPLDSHETCDITDHTLALNYMLQVTTNVKYADRIEKIIFNALPGAITKDFKSLQYLSCPNQFIVTHKSNHNRFKRGFNWMSYRPDTEVQCCSGNVHRAMPNYISRQWLKRGENEIIAALYGPGMVQTRVSGTPVTIKTDTSYPAEQTIRFEVMPEEQTEFTFTVRIPTWCKQASLSLNGEVLNMPLLPGTFVPVQRNWQRGDTLLLQLPYSLALQHFPRGGISIDYGPLTFSLPIHAHAEIEKGDSTNEQRKDVQGEFHIPRAKGATAEFPAWDFTPVSDWNYALCLDEKSLSNGTIKIQWNKPSSVLFDEASPFITLQVPVRTITGWDLVRRENPVQWVNRVIKGKWKIGARRLKGSYAFTPQLPSRKKLKNRLNTKIEWVDLVPYGCTLLRLTVFPQAQTKA